MNDWLRKYPQFTIKTNYISIPPTKVWDYRFWEENHPEMIVMNTMPGAKKGEFWWAPNSGEVFKYWYTYQSWWLPIELFDIGNIKKLTRLFYNASRLTTVAVHMNKGLGGASTDAVRRTSETSTNPSVLNAAALVIMGAGSNEVDHGIKGQEPNKEQAEEEVHKINKAMNYFRRTAPHAGAYVNEADYFEKDWQRVFWGDNYGRLLKIKKQYDPDGLFICHHCVGSEYWKEDGNCRKAKH